MSLNTFLKMTGGIGFLLITYFYLPILQGIEVLFWLVISAVWGFVLIDLVLMVFGVIPDITNGISATTASWLEKFRSRTHDIKEDLRNRVDAIQNAPTAA